MGYTTEFSGHFTLDKKLLPEHAAYLRQFAHTRRMNRDLAIAATLPDPIRTATDLPIGQGGAYFVGGTGEFGQNRDASVCEGNKPPPGQPGLWCEWVPTADDCGVKCDEGENFYNYVEWLVYLIEHFLKPWGYTLNGEVEWQGEESGDMGKIAVAGNAVTFAHASIGYHCWTPA